ncbi:MAG: hypothetical protein GY828_08125, partial [Candidatus Gracilibacteria bacterium]|nr:hypothetical protein [Candidatus Gracilibacteria bacterium]
KIFFDEKLGNGTGVVGFIALIILAVGICQTCTSAVFTKTNILEVQVQNKTQNVVYIDGVAYNVLFQKIQ